MNRALLTIGVGPHEELLEIALPGFEQFAARHGYELLLPEVDCDRPVSWWKIPALTAALAEFDEVLWLDADVVLVDDTDDLPFVPEAWQMLVEHQTNDGRVPNLGVWMVRKPMLPVLNRVWGMREFLNHPWWEQAALVHLMGYRGRPLAPSTFEELRGNTCFLDLSWNVHRDDHRTVDWPRFQHATCWPDRASIMRDWAGLVAA